MEVISAYEQFASAGLSARKKERYRHLIRLSHFHFLLHHHRCPYAHNRDPWSPSLHKACRGIFLLLWSLSAGRNSQHPLIADRIPTPGGRSHSSIFHSCRLRCLFRSTPVHCACMI